MLTAGTFETIPVSVLVKNGLMESRERHHPVVLVVDDEQIIADTRAAILTGWGYAVLTAYDAESALELARLIPPELLITDIMLTGMNGIDLAIAIQLEIPDCKVLLFSGRADGLDLIARAENAIQSFQLLTKPLHPSQLWSVLNNLNLGEFSSPLEKPALN